MVQFQQLMDERNGTKMFGRIGNAMMGMCMCYMHRFVMR